MYRTDIVKDTIDEVWNEIGRQEELWGVQLHPDGTGNITYKGLMAKARALCDKSAEEGTLTYAHILLEEVYEALAEKPNSPELIEELVQVVAVAMSWIRILKARVR